MADIEDAAAAQKGWKMMTMASLFDGSGGFPEAARRHGIVPMYASEVEPYPIAVTKTQFPGMKHLGNVSEIHGDELSPVDVITFGSPCQDLSVAGKLAGIHEGSRSSLFFEAVRIIKEMRTNDEAAGRSAEHVRPRFAVWENVPGAFSSHKGEDFRAVLQALAEIGDPEVSIPMPEKGKWAKAGCIVGDGWSIAWRTYDAQFWGVPQRRKRIYLIADFGSERTGEILFEREGVRRHIAPSGAAWQGAAEDAQGSPASHDRAGESASSSRPQNLHTEQGGDPARHTDGEGGHPRAHGNAPAAGEGIGLESAGRGLDAVVPFAANQRDEVRVLGDKAGAIQAQPGMKQQTFLAYHCAFHLQQDPVSGKISPCIGGQHQATVGVCLSVNIDRAAGFKAGQSMAGGIGWQEECAATLSAECSGTEPTVCIKTYDARGNGDGNVVNTITGDHENRITDYTSLVVEAPPVYSLQGNILDRNAQQNGSGICENVSHTVNAVDRHGVAYCVENGQLNQISMAEQANTLDCMHDRQAVVVFDKEVYNSGINCNGGHYISDNGIAPNLRTMHPPGVATQYIVRRLTPTECARLQGFPDTWGHPDKKDSFTPEEYAFWLEVRNTHAAINGKQVKDYTEAQMLKWYNGLHTDSAEYKMWGNGIALPCAEDVMGRIAKELRRKHDE